MFRPYLQGQINHLPFELEEVIPFFSHKGLKWLPVMKRCNTSLIFSIEILILH